MTCLSKLPVEILTRICQFVGRMSANPLQNLCLANKTFNEIGSPWLIQRWSHSQDCPTPHMIPFLLRLLEHPKLRKQIKSLGIIYESTLGAPHTSIELDKKTRSHLSKTAASDVNMETYYLASLCAHIQRGYEDALAVLFLAWCPGLTHLSLTIPQFSVIEGDHSHILTFAREAILQLTRDEETGENLPLAELRHIELHCYDRWHWFYYEMATMFFHLPKLKSLLISGLSDFPTIEMDWTGEYADRYTLPISDASSTIEELILTKAGLASDGLETLLIGIKNLRKLKIQLSHSPQEDIPDREQIAETIKICQGTLEEYDIQIESHRCLLDPDSRNLDYDLLADEILLVEDIYQDFIHLRRISCPMTDLLCQVPDDTEHKLNIILSRLPGSIEYLKPRCPDMVNGWVSSEERAKPYTEAFVKLLNQAGSGQWFHNLKVLDLSETFVDDPDTVDIVRLKDIAKSRGVQLLLHQG
ncbi:hypothetical protein FLONG3_5344 [Fusarium longipes]|uniref:F-box domain-containing protein n=1 Tax=Fusarium longipes TaxID=694270 RepID=A0A395SUX6_9HYPO|nr:hypothetical protein FLONG3_5344 [Fusarium longipes]